MAGRKLLQTEKYKTDNGTTCFCSRCSDALSFSAEMLAKLG